jgi:capsular polysaccharide biosynthesis protein
VFQVEELHYASGFSMYGPSAEMIGQIRKALNVQELPASERTKIIFVSRVDGSQRHVENEEGLIAELRKAFPTEEVSYA